MVRVPRWTFSAFGPLGFRCVSWAGVCVCVCVSLVYEVSFACGTQRQDRTGAHRQAADAGYDALVIARRIHGIGGRRAGCYSRAPIGRDADGCRWTRGGPDGPSRHGRRSGYGTEGTAATAGGRGSPEHSCTGVRWLRGMVWRGERGKGRGRGVAACWSEVGRVLTAVAAVAAVVVAAFSAVDSDARGARAVGACGAGARVAGATGRGCGHPCGPRRPADRSGGRAACDSNPGAAERAAALHQDHGTGFTRSADCRRGRNVEGRSRSELFGEGGGGRGDEQMIIILLAVHDKFLPACVKYTDDAVRGGGYDLDQPARTPG